MKSTLLFLFFCYPAIVIFSQIDPMNATTNLSNNFMEIQKKSITSMPDSNITLIGRWANGPCNASYVIDTLAFVGQGCCLDVVNMADSENPVLVNRLMFQNKVTDIDIEDNTAYLAIVDSGVAIVDITEVTAPQIVGGFLTEGYINKIDIRDSIVFIAERDSLSIVDCHDPGNPQLISYFDCFGYHYDIQVQGNYAYVSSSIGGFNIFDIHDYNSPFHVANIDSLIFTEGLYISDPWVFVTDYEYGLVTYKISNPEEPEFVSTFNPETSYDDVYIKNFCAYLNNHNDLDIVDIYDPYNPQLLSSVSIGAFYYGGINHVFVGNDYGYFCDNSTGLQIYDVSDPETPNWESTYITGGCLSDIAVKGNYAFLATSKFNLIVVDQSNPDSIFEIAKLPTGYCYYKIEIEGDYLFASHYYMGFSIFNIEDPFNPYVVSETTTYASKEDIEINDSILYITDGNILSIYNVVDKETPELISSVNTGYTENIILHDTIIVVAARDSGIYFVNVANPYNPILVLHYEDKPAHYVFEHNQLLYVKSSYHYPQVPHKGYYILDISEISEPEILVEFPETVCKEIFVKDDFLFNINEENGNLEIFNNADIFYPFPIACFSPLTNWSHLKYHNDTIYLLDCVCGYYILKNDFVTGIDYQKNQNGYIEQNFPNPFKNFTTFPYYIGSESNITFQVYGLDGILYYSKSLGSKKKGKHQHHFDASHFSPGIYFYRFIFNSGYSETGKMIIVK